LIETTSCSRSHRAAAQRGACSLDLAIAIAAAPYLLLLLLVLDPSYSRLQQVVRFGSHC